MVGCSAEFYRHRSSRRIELPDSRLELPVSSGPCGIPADVGPRSLASPGSSSLELDPLFRVRSCFSPGVATEVAPPPPRVCVPIATRACGVHLPDDLSRPSFWSALSVSHALDGLRLHQPCGLISSHCHVRGSHFKGFPRCPAAAPHRHAVPSCDCRVSPRGKLPSRCQLRAPLLQDVTPSSDPLWPTGGLDLPALDPFLGFQLLRVFLRTPWACLHAPSAHDLGCVVLAVPSAAGLQRVNRCSTWRSVPRQPTRTSFVAASTLPK
jgi:hypothetical protein